VLVDRHDQVAGRIDRLVLEEVRPFVDVPAVVLEAGTRPRCVVDLLPVALADVADPEVAGLAVEGEAPGVAQAVALDTPPAGAVWVDGEKLAQLVVEVLRPVLGIA